MPDNAVSPSAPEPLHLARVIPAGGSKWAHSFSGPTTVIVSEGGVIIRAGAVVHPNGEVFEDGVALEQRDADVFPLAAGEGVSLGRFILGLAASIKTDPREFEYCGARLSPPQAEILQKLGKADGYEPLSGTTRFRTAIKPAQDSAKSVPGSQLRALAGRLRAPAMAGNKRLAILPARETERFALTNRASLMAWLRAKKFEVIEPEAMPFDVTAGALAAAALVILADPEQAGLVSFCPPGAKILEIAPEGWLGARTRWFCQLFGLEWTPFLANAPAYPLLNALPFGARVPLSYEIPIGALAKTLDALG